MSSLEAGRAAAEKHAWLEAFELLGASDAESELGPADLELLAYSAWWSGNVRDCMSARERAFAAYQQVGNRGPAMRMAAALAYNYEDTKETTIAGAWAQRAKKLFAEDPECPDAGYVLVLTARAAMDEGDLRAGIEQGARVLELGTRHGDRDLMAFGLGIGGYGKLFSGEIEEGLAMLDEATIAAVSGELGPFATGITYCMMISASSQLADYQRAGQWSEAARRWCERQSIAGFPGICRVHHAEVLRLRGSFAEAEHEASKATIELRNFNVSFTAEAFHELGEVRLRMGDLPGAEDAFKQSFELGADPQPGFALLQLRQGNPSAALASLIRTLDHHPPGIPSRAKLLPAVVEVAIAAGSIDRARALTTELCEAVKSFTSPAMRGSAEFTTALVAAYDGDTEGARTGATRAMKLWRQIDVPYEVARCRALLGETYLAESDFDSARLEFEAARTGFERLGAMPDAADVSKRIDALSRPAARTERKTFMFTDIVSSSNLLEAIGDAAWTPLIDWHDRTLRGLFTAHDGEEVKHTGDGFFVAFDDVVSAVDCAIAIQSTLAEHRRTAGFAPQVRIGLHATDAARVEGDYFGRGVHESARIGGIASGSEILVSAETIAGCGIEVPTMDAREVPLKGFSEPVPVVSVDWRRALT